MTTPRSETAHAARRGAAAALPIIVKHPACPQWGLGLLIEERDGKRFFDFEDGMNHSIAKDHWSKLETVELGGDEARAVESRIREIREKASTPAKKTPRRPTPTAPKTSFEEQVVQFEKDFPGGFAGDAFVTKERGVAPAPGEADAPKKKSKAPVEGAIAAARVLLGADEVSALLAAGNHAEVAERVRKVQKSATGLLHPLGDVIPFSKLPAERYPAIAQATFELLHGEGDHAARFDRFVGVLAQDKLGTWPLATVLGALAAPGEQAFVKPSYYEKQAMVLGFDLAYERTPSAAAYARMLELSRLVKARLEERGLAPRDLLDVNAFMVRTLK
jgi:hypothetical protein